MADLDNILIFVKVAQFESISRAARSLGMPISTVSRRLSVLESELGVSLLRRTTRRVTLTPQGREYFNQCQEPLTLLQEAERVLTAAQTKPEGLLRITAPVILSQDPFLSFISRFLKEHPRIRIDLFITNAFVDLLAQNIDAAIRFGELKDSSVVATRLGKSIRYVVAAPEYLQGRKLPAFRCPHDRWHRQHCGACTSGPQQSAPSHVHYVHRLAPFIICLPNARHVPRSQPAADRAQRPSTR